MNKAKGRRQEAKGVMKVRGRRQEAKGTYTKTL
jgi:hypothetical protein